MNMKKIIGKLLLAFVLVSIGYALGSTAARRADAPSAAETGAAPETTGASSSAQTGVAVVFMHGTFRCATCNRIETLARTLIERDFADALADGRVTWRAANFQLEPDLAARYDVGSSTLVMSRMQDGREVEFRRLDDVWTTIGDETAFTEYVEGVLRELLGKARS